MNPEIRAAIIKLYEERIISMESDIPALLKQRNQIKEENTVRTIHMMRDAGELVPEGQYGALRLSLKAVEAQAPPKVRLKKYMLDNWMILAALALSAIGTISGIAGTIIALIALNRN